MVGMIGMFGAERRHESSILEVKLAKNAERGCFPLEDSMAL